MSDDKRAKLRKLLALAAGTGNEAEALAAIEKAHAYAETYGLSLDDIKAGGNEANEFETSEPMFSNMRGSRHAWRNWSACDWHLWKPLAKFCGVKVRVTVDKDGDNALQYFGHYADVELVRYLRAVINRAMTAEWIVYRDYVMPAADRANETKVNTAMLSFTLEMSLRLRERMDEITNAREAASAAEVTRTGNSLMVAKNALVERKAKEVGFVEHQGRKGGHHAYDAAAGAAGRMSGDRVNFGRGVSGSKVKMIGR